MGTPPVTGDDGFKEPPSLVDRRPADTAVVEVTVLRHGEGVHNVNTSSLAKAGWELINDLLTFKIYDAAIQSKKIVMGTYAACSMRDPSLTGRGVAEARGAGLLADCPFDVVYVSPMQRTIETALIVFGRIKGLKIVLHPGCCETRTLLEGSNAGRRKEEIEKKVAQLKDLHDTQAEIDLSYLPTTTWWVPLAETTTQLTQRASLFRSFLLTQPHSKVAIVSHATFLSHLTGDTSRLTTCQWKSYLCTKRGFLSSNGPKGTPDAQHCLITTG